MKKCVVKDCESTDSASSVSFHPFPENPHYRLLWLSRIKYCNFNKHSVVCGLHFKPEDYDEHNQLRHDAIPENIGCSNSTPSHDKISTKKPLIVITANNLEDNHPSIDVYPSTLNITIDIKEERLEIEEERLEIEEERLEIEEERLEIEEERLEIKEERIETKEVVKEDVIPDESTNLKACRACLAVGCKMFPLTNKKLKQAYNQVTGLRAPAKDGLPQLLCWECSSRVLSAAKFRDRAKTAHDILAVLKCRHGSINMGVIRSVNRQRKKLSSQLSHEYNVHTDGNLTEITKYDNVDNNAECHNNDINDECEVEYIDSSISPSGLDGCHEYEVISAKSEDEIDQPLKYVNDDNRIDDERSLSSSSSDIRINDDVVPIKSVQKTINTKTFKKIKKVRSQKLTDRKVSSNKRSPKVDMSKFFTVTNVKPEDAIASVQDRKHSSLYINAPFQCKICYRGYFIKDRYEAHVLKHTEKFGEFECEVCKIRCRSKRYLAEHQQLHRKTYSCLRCDHVTGCRSVAVQHIKYHDGAVYQCPHCPKQLQRKSSYYSHLRMKHACEFACDLCGHTFLNKQGMESHRRRRHILDNTTPLAGPYCLTCDVTFASQKAHDTHLTMSSKHNKDNHLDIVNGYFPTSKCTDVTRSRRKCAAKLKPVTCEQCGETLQNVLAYVHHFRKKHPTATRTQHRTRNGAVCEYCGKTSQHPAVMKYHIAAHTGQYVTCDYCGKNFHKKTNLIIHMRQHQPSRPHYPCEICGKQFTDISNRGRHLRIHTNPAPYECDLCGKRLTTFAGVQDHIDHVHNGKPWPKRKRPRTTE